MKIRRPMVYSAAAVICAFAALAVFMHKQNPGVSRHKEDDGVYREDAWVHDPPNTIKALFQDSRYGGDHGGADKDWVSIAPDQVSGAIQRLEQRPFLPLTVAKARQLSEKNLPPLPAQRRYYLLRAFAQSPSVFSVAGYFWVDCGMLSHSNNVLMERRPLIVNAAQPPRDVFLTFSVAE